MFFAKDVNKLVYQKSDSEDRLVCYCFQHSVKDIRQEVRRSGSTDVYEEISKMCKNGLDSCPSKNPQGACCLGNINSVIQTALSDYDKTDSDGLKRMNGGPCCNTEDNADEVSGGSTIATPIALIAALFSSSCCWLPLTLVIFGGSSLGLSTILDAAGIPLLVIAGCALTVSFYLIYIRKTEFKKNDRTAKLTQTGFWASAIVVLVFAKVPDVISGFFGKTLELILSQIPGVSV